MNKEKTGEFLYYQTAIRVVVFALLSVKKKRRAKNAKIAQYPPDCTVGVGSGGPTTVFGGTVCGMK